MDDAYQGLNRLPARSGGLMSFMSVERIIDGPWDVFEKTILRLLIHTGWKQVIHTGRSGDMGADIIGIDTSGKKVVLQCKFKRSTTSIGESGVNELRNACDFYGTAYGIVVTNTSLSSTALERISQLSASGYKFIYWDGNKLMEMGEKLEQWSTNRYPLRDYQEEAVSAVFQNYANGNQRSLVEMATGLGKTIVLAEVAVQLLLEDPDRKVLLLAHTLPLLKQLENAIWSQIPSSVPTQLWSGNSKPIAFDGITVGMFQTVHSAIRSMPRNEMPEFDIVMVDEAHHTPAVTFSEALEVVGTDKILGVTATPWRGDGERLEAIFGEAVFKKGILEGIERGFLSDIEYHMMLDNVNWLEVASCSRGSYTIGDLNNRLFLPSRDEDLVDKVLKNWKKIGRPQTITFCKRVEHAENLQAIMNAVGISSRILVGRNTLADRAKTLMDFRAGEFSNLIGVEMLNEGIDVPDVGLIIFARVTHSRRIFVQQLGRGLRVKEGKDRVHVMDFVADIRRLASGIQLNTNARRRADSGVEFYRGRGANMVTFEQVVHESFVDEYLADVADLDEDERITLNFIDP